MEQKTFEKLKKKKFEKISHSTKKKINNKHFFEDEKKTIEGLDILHNTIHIEMFFLCLMQHLRDLDVDLVRKTC